MNRKQKENEEKLFKAVQDLKDSFFGLKQPYTRYCYDRTEENGLVFNWGKADAFAAVLFEFSPQTRVYGEDLEKAVRLFFRVTVRLLDAICHSGDWIFVSFRKLAETALKSSPEEESVYERIVKNHSTKIDDHFPDGSFWPEYEDFCTFMGQVDSERFYYCVKYTVEAFLDDRRLNVLDRDQLTESVITRISRLSAAIERDLLRTDAAWEDE